MSSSANDSVVVLGEDSSSSSSTSSDTSSVADSSTSVPSENTSAVATMALDDAQYAELLRYMSTQLYVSLAIFAAVGLCLGALVAQQVLRRWGVR